jgi:hypothetical protein
VADTGGSWGGHHRETSGIRLIWDGMDASSDWPCIYLYRLRAGSYRLEGKVVHVR